MNVILNQDESIYAGLHHVLGRRTVFDTEYFRGYSFEYCFNELKREFNRLVKEEFIDNSYSTNFKAHFPKRTVEKVLSNLE